MKSLVRLTISAMCISAMAQATQAPAPTSYIPGSADERKLIGTWQLIRFENTSKDGKIVKPYGERPSGYFVYDATGHLSVQIMLNPPLPPLASKPTDAEKVQAYNAYLAYFGTYRVDQANHILHHQVEGALDTSYT